MSVCYYDLETTGLGQGVEIISIGATVSNGPWAMGDFEVFIQPDGPIHPNATRVHGMYKDQYGRLTDRNDRIVSTAYVERPGFQSGFAGLEMFLHWLHQAECRFLVRFSSKVKYLSTANCSSTYYYYRLPITTPGLMPLF